MEICICLFIYFLFNGHMPTVPKELSILLVLVKILKLELKIAVNLSKSVYNVIHNKISI
jgi:hypothetical protein